MAKATCDECGVKRAKIAVIWERGGITVYSLVCYDCMCGFINAIVGRIKEVRKL